MFQVCLEYVLENGGGGVSSTWAQQFGPMRLLATGGGTARGEPQGASTEQSAQSRAPLAQG